jgi:polysaccharide export outer membrane protein
MKSLFGKNVEANLGRAGLVILAGLLVWGCQSSQPSPVFSTVPTDESLPGEVGDSAIADGARISRGDMIKVTFSGLSTQIAPHEEQVKDDGSITLPHIGTIRAEGKTTGDLQREIHAKYVPDYYTRLTVTVTTDRQVYYVLGQVKAPNRQQYIGPTTVLKAIASASDFTDFADRRRVVLTRADGTRIVVDCIKAARDAAFDLPVYPGDKIEVPMRRPFSGWFW